VQEQRVAELEAMHEDAEQRARAARDEAAAARDDAERRVAHAAVTARTKAIEEQSALVREARASEAYARIRYRLNGVRVLKGRHQVDES